MPFVLSVPTGVVVLEEDMLALLGVPDMLGVPKVLGVDVVGVLSVPAGEVLGEDMSAVREAWESFVILSLSYRSLCNTFCLFLAPIF
ncbi:hypothetical protein GCM10023262_11490 [Bartonella pachyuromydis]|uniref:Uncharacterized protein n=1 Tax=Bartonella pachyuromydis TaxID=931097 RepID=A0ABP8VIX7_9HYPH